MTEEKCFLFLLREGKMSLNKLLDEFTVKENECYLCLLTQEIPNLCVSCCFTYCDNCYEKHEVFHDNVKHCKYLDCNKCSMEFILT